MRSKELTERRHSLINSELAIDPEIPTLTLAKKLYNSNQDVFASVKGARRIIQYIRGEGGNGDRAVRGISKPAKKRIVNSPIGNIVPPSDEPPEKVEPVKLKLSGYGTIIADVHVPYHDERNLRIALEYSESKGATDWLLINGDFMDFYQASYFNKNPKSRRLQDELDLTVKLLSDMAKYYDRVIYKLGNHERRWQNYLYANAPDIADMRCLTYQEIFRASDLKIEIIEPQQIMYVGKYLTILHGHEFGGSFFNPVNPARGAYLRAKNNCIVGHHHRPSEHVESDIRGVITSTFSLGCLCQLRVPYAPARSSYVPGFITAHISGDDFEIENHRITPKGKVR